MLRRELTRVSKEKEKMTKEEATRKVEQAALALSCAFAALEEVFPAPAGHIWCVMGDHRVILMPVPEVTMTVEEVLRNGHAVEETDDCEV